MLQRQRPLSVQRQGFTLVELLVVILIISILSALLTVAVTKGIGAAKRTRNAVDLRQLDGAVKAFKVKYGVDIPSRIFLSSKASGYPAGSTGLIGDSYSILTRIWPRLFATGNDVYWNGVNNSNTAVILSGDQCIVFFLGGIPDSSGVPVCRGFAKDPSDPAAHVRNATNPTNPPLYDFDSSRLVRLHRNAPAMFSYLDTYGTSDGNGNWISGLPYMYFSSFGNRNGYNPYGTSDCPWTSNDASGVFSHSDLPFEVYPYAQGSGQYLNPQGFQIISGGADGRIGVGTSSMAAANYWTPANAANSGAILQPNKLGQPGADDQSNFYDNLLGTPSIN